MASKPISWFPCSYCDAPAHSQCVTSCGHAKPWGEYHDARIKTANADGFWVANLPEPGGPLAAQSDGSEQKPGRKSHDATSARASAPITFCMDDGCRRSAGHDGPHDITWQATHSDGAIGAPPQTGASE